MNDIQDKSDAREITVKEVFPYAPSAIWKTITTGQLIARWLMEPIGFEPVVGNQFTFQTTAAGLWDGVIYCKVLEIDPEKCFAFSWRGGHPANKGYGSPLDTVVRWEIDQVEEGTILRLTHSGFESPANDTPFLKMSDGWVKVVARVGEVAASNNDLLN